MKNGNKLEKLLKDFLKQKSSSAVSPQMNEKIISDSLAVFEKSKPTAPFYFTAGVIKYAVAAAILIAAILIGQPFRQSQNQNNAIAKIAAQISNANALAYSVTTKANTLSTPTVQTQWTYNKQGQIRINTDDGYISILFDKNKSSGIGVLPKEKKYIEIELTNIRNIYNPFIIIKKIKSLGNDSYRSIGNKKIEGKIAEGFRSIVDNIATTIWVDTAKPELVRMDIEYCNESDMNITAQNFVLKSQSGRPDFSVLPVKDFEKASVWLLADATFANEHYINKFLNVCLGCRDKDGIFSSISAASMKPAYSLAQDNRLNVCKNWTNFKLVYPY